MAVIYSKVDIIKLCHGTTKSLVHSMTPTHVPLLPLYLRPRFLIYSYSLSNVLSHHALMYLVRSIASNQAYS